MYKMPTCTYKCSLFWANLQSVSVCLSLRESVCVYICVFLCVSVTDLEAVQQYEKMLSIEEALMGAEPDVNIEEITEVSCLSTA